LIICFDNTHLSKVRRRHEGIDINKNKVINNKNKVMNDKNKDLIKIRN
jgi:hypothetical protein